jgi:hypothetical protein
MTNPKNEWHGGNYNDAFWHGFGQGATAGSAIVGIVNICEGIASVWGKATDSGAQGWEWCQKFGEIFSKETVHSDVFGDRDIVSIIRDVASDSSALLSGSGGASGVERLFAGWAKAQNPFENEYFKDFYDITVNNAYDIYTGRTRDIYKLYLISATRICGEKYIDAGIEKTKLVNMNLFSKGVFNYLTGNVINGNTINRHDAVNSGLRRANPLIVSTRLLGNIHYNDYVKAVEDLSRL